MINKTKQTFFKSWKTITHYFSLPINLSIGLNIAFGARFGISTTFNFRVYNLVTQNKSNFGRRLNYSTDTLDRFSNIEAYKYNHSKFRPFTIYIHILDVVNPNFNGIAVKEVLEKGWNLLYNSKSLFLSWGR